jgi:hypothetical protein
VIKITLFCATFQYKLSDSYFYNMKDDNIEHRNCGWRPMYEEDLTPEWVSVVLIPWLKSETGIDWKIVGNHLLNSETTTMFLPISSMWDKLGGIFANNVVPSKIKKKYPVLREDDFGYKIEKRIHPKNRPRQHIAYEGFWALSVHTIIKRGSITGKKFGL